jgi:hypothetical protein
MQENAESCFVFEVMQLFPYSEPMWGFTIRFVTASLCVRTGEPDY